ncbi:6393_t:CDS:1, partial [Racocetra fulgida]
LISQEEAMSYIPLFIEYPPDTSTCISSINVGGLWPAKISSWDSFFDDVIQYKFDQEPKFERPQFVDKGLEIVVEPNVGTAMEVNIFRILNILAGSYYKFSKQKDSDLKSYDPSIGNCKPDYT